MVYNQYIFMYYLIIHTFLIQIKVLTEKNYENEKKNHRIRSQKFYIKVPGTEESQPHVL